jgi:hypothetical protein
MKLVARAGETTKTHTLKAMLDLQVCKTHLNFFHGTLAGTPVFKFGFDNSLVTSSVVLSQKASQIRLGKSHRLVRVAPRTNQLGSKMVATNGETNG